MLQVSLIHQCFLLWYLEVPVVFLLYATYYALSDSTVSEDAVIEPRTIGTGHWQSGALTTQLYLIQKVKVI
jgi:hypothetical protein